MLRTTDLLCRARVKVVRDASLRTYRALLVYLLDGSISFARLTAGFFSGADVARAEGAPPPATQSFAARWMKAHAARKAWMGKAANATLLASPKSMYRLADKMGLDELKRKAEEAYMAAINPEVSWKERRSRSSRPDSEAATDCHL